MQLKRIHHVAYRCRDAKETVEFYQRVLGMGFVLAIAHPKQLDLVSVNINNTITDSVGAEFVVPTIDNEDGGGTRGVVLDFDSPFEGQTIPVGMDNHIANFCCPS